MDLSNAALLIAAVYGLTELVKALLPGAWKANSRIVAAIAVVVAFAAVFLVGATSWADEQVIGTVSLDLMSVADKVLVAIFVAGASGLVYQGVQAVRNIGANQPPSVESAVGVVNDSINSGTFPGKTP